MACKNLCLRMVQYTYMKGTSLPDKLPPALYKFFWDIDATKLNPSEYVPYVINRLLDKGDLEAARWVLHSFPRTTIIETLKTMRDFSPWNGRFWASYLEIPEEEVACLREPYLTQRKQLWPF